MKQFQKIFAVVVSRETFYPERLFDLSLPPAPSDRARALHSAVPVADLHIDMLLTHYLFGYDIMKRHKNLIPFSPLVNQADIPRLKEAGVAIAGVGLVCNPLKIYQEKRQLQINSQLDYLKRLCAQYPKDIMHLMTAQDMKEAIEKGAIACLPGIEGAHSLNGKIERLDEYYDRGVRYFTLAHFSGNEACNCPKGIYNTNPPGLTDFGRALVDRIRDLGMILDVAHTEKLAFLEAVDRTDKPMIVSHTGVSGVFEHWRNVDDEQISAVAKKGGIIGVMIAPNYLGGTNFRPLSDVADHIVYVAEKFGPEYVCLGSDMDGWIQTMPKGFSDATDLPKITDDLLSRGMDDNEVAKIMGLNVKRVIEACL